jgi:hypothetical protein
VETTTVVKAVVVVDLAAVATDLRVMVHVLTLEALHHDFFPEQNPA